ncbi:MAG: methionine gamma-lyase [Pyrinomonadaceae bacterium]
MNAQKPEDDKLDISTQLVHAGRQKTFPQGKPTATPIYASATFSYDSMQEFDEAFAGVGGDYIYTRYGNPTIAGLEEAMRVLEAGADARAFASGMAALHASFIACEINPGATVLASQDLYGATTSLLQNVFCAFGVRTVMFDFDDIQGLREKARVIKPRVLIAETISNPLLKVCDLEAVSKIAREIDARLVVDNTFASPYLCQPIKHGADFVVHSATKYLSGHADATGGIVVARDEFDMTALTAALKLVGGVLSVWEAHLISRGIKTLGLRVERACENARTLAEKLSEHPKIARVFHPSLVRTDAEREIIKRIIRAPHTGALVSIELRENTREAAFRFMENLNLCVRATSLGDVFTGVLHPATASHRDLAPVRRQQLGIGDGLVRISVGIENVEDIARDIERALE